MTTALPSVVSVEEYEAAEVRLRREEYRALRVRYAGKLDIDPSDRTGVYTVTSRGYAGRAAFPGTLLVFRPKVPVANLGYMLAAAAGLVSLYRPHVHVEADCDAFALTASALVWEAERLAAQGLGTGFEERRAPLPLVRGRILLREQLRLHGDLKHVHVCAYAEHTADTIENQVLFAGLRQAVLLTLPADGSLRARVRALLALSADVKPISPREAADALSNLSLHRLNARYAHALALCALLLNGIGPAEKPGNHALPSFLVDMASLFEAFVTARLRALLPRHGLRAIAQHRDYLDEAGHVGIRPDLLIYRAGAGTPAMVVDAKYRRPNSADRNRDLYQIGAYMARFGLLGGALVYPGPVRATPRHIVLRGSGGRIGILSLDLSAPTPAALDAKCAHLASELARLVRANERANATLSGVVPSQTP